MERRQTSVLVVEDNPGDARLIKEYLSESTTIDADITLVVSLAEAVEVLLYDQVDIVLLDLSLSDSSGLGSVRLLVRTASRTPIVVLSGNEDPELIQEAVQAGAQDYLPKKDASSSILSRVIGSAIERQTMLVERDTLATIGRVISSNLDIDSVFTLFAAEVRTLIPVVRMVLSWDDGVEDHLVNRFMWDSATVNGDISEQFLIPLHSREIFRSAKDGVIGWREPYFEKIAAHRAESESRSIGLASAMFAPLSAGDETVGLLRVLTNDEDAYSKKHLELLETITNQISGAVHAADLYDKAVLWAEEREQRLLLEAQKQELERTNQIKSQIITTVTHELKTPLTSMIAFIDILSRNPLGNLIEKQLDQLEVLRRNGSHLHLLINDLLDHSRIESGTFELFVSAFDANLMLKGLGESFEPLVKSAGQTISVKIPAGRVLVSGDQNRISQTISNLLSNATKYAGGGANIRLEARVSGEIFTVEVIDDGVGMSADDANSAFDLYYRAENHATRSVPGLGLGLNISRAIVKMHHGRMYIDSELNRGTRIGFKIPCVIAESDQVA
ncbi:MAG: response regulator [Chloroflexi bacterium]|nr:response regulator [Chloroflexota bacterium]